MLQQNKVPRRNHALTRACHVDTAMCLQVLKVIGKKMTRKALAMIKSLADAEQLITAEIMSDNRRDHES